VNIPKSRCFRQERVSSGFHESRLVTSLASEDTPHKIATEHGKAEISEVLR
jgi:hypothetical protein